MNTKAPLALILIFLAAAATLAAGRISLDDPMYFEERPRMVEEGGKYFFEWVYGEWGFAFFPKLKLKGEKAVFFLSATTSSGQLRGRRVRNEIRKRRALKLIREGEAYWEEPGGNLVKLEVVSVPKTTRKEADRSRFVP